MRRWFWRQRSLIAAEGDFLVYVMSAESFEQSKHAAMHSTHAIDGYHRQFKREVWEEIQELEPLVHLERISELERS
jgi:hypothetical protein